MVYSDIFCRQSARAIVGKAGLGTWVVWGEHDVGGVEGRGEGAVGFCEGLGVCGVGV